MARRLRVIWISLILLVAAAVPVGASSGSGGEQDTTVLDWNRHAIAALTGQPPPVLVQHLAMVQGAVFDAVNMIDRGYEAYLDKLPRAPRSASKSAAAATAAHDVLVGLSEGVMPDLPGSVITQLGVSLAASLALIPDGPAKTHGIAAGEAAAEAMLEAREDDGRYGGFTFTPGDGTVPGEWVVTASGSDPNAWVAEVDPFTMKRTSQFRTDGPFDLDSRSYAREYQEVKDYGGNGIVGGTPTLRSPEQTALALFFTANPVEMYNRTFRTIAVDRGLSIVGQARLFAMLNVAGADALIGCWDDKAHWNFWRPETAIHQGDDDGNHRTEGDTAWTSLVASPPYPDHPSGYNCVTGAFMHTAKDFFGKDRVSFKLVKLATPTTPEAVREYRRFTDVIDDTIEARIFLGIHFRAPDVQGAELGEDVARWVSKHFFEKRR